MKNEFKTTTGFKCTQCGKIYSEIPGVCGCGQFSWLGNFKPVFETLKDSDDWELIEISVYDYPVVKIESQDSSTFKQEYGDPDIKRIWVSPDFEGEIKVKSRRDIDDLDFFAKLETIYSA